MASRVKATISKENLLKALEDRKKVLLTPVEPEPFDTKKLMKDLELVMSQVKTGKAVDIQQDLFYDLLAYNRSLKEKSEAGYKEKNLAERIDRQIKLINLSSNIEFQIGINDELYELL